MDIEQEIQAKGLTAPRVTPADVEEAIVSQHFFTAMDGLIGQAGTPHIVAGTPIKCPLDLLTFCVLVLRNGFTVTGESACASPENFDEEIGRKIARQNAVQKVWPLLGFRLRDRLTASAAVGFGPTHEPLDGGTYLNTTFMDAVLGADSPIETPEAEARPITPGLALDSGEFIPAAEIPPPFV